LEVFITFGQYAFLKIEDPTVGRMKPTPFRCQLPDHPLLEKREKRGTPIFSASAQTVNALH